MNIIAEFEFMIDYAAESDFDEKICCDQMRTLWTAFCLHHDLDADTHIYDYYLSKLWRTMTEKKTPDWSDFTQFELFMCEYLV